MSVRLESPSLKNGTNFGIDSSTSENRRHEAPKNASWATVAWILEGDFINLSSFNAACDREHDPVGKACSILTRMRDLGLKTRLVLAWRLNEAGLSSLYHYDGNALKPFDFNRTVLIQRIQILGIRGPYRDHGLRVSRIGNHC